MLSYAWFPSSMMGPRWNSTLLIAIFGTSATIVLLRAFAKVGLVSLMANSAFVGVISITSIFIGDHSTPFVPFVRPSSSSRRAAPG